MANLSEFLGSSDTAVFSDVQSNGVAGTIIASTATVIPFNTEVIPKNFVSLSTNQFTLDSGSYIIKIVDSFTIQETGPAEIQYWIKEVSGSSLGGTRDYTSADTDQATGKEFMIPLSLSASTVIEIYAECSSSSLTKSAITPSDGSSEYYQQIYITKIG